MPLSQRVAACQALRIASFMSTRLPGPGYHCRIGEPTAVRPWVSHWSQHLIVDVKRQVSKSCGDLMFSSHTIFIASGLITYIEFGTDRLMKALLVVVAIMNSLLIVASRKHYTVDVLVAWCAVSLFYHQIAARWNIERDPLQEGFGKWADDENING